jgi:hypothetical protein
MQRAPDVASNGRNYFVVWRDNKGNSGGNIIAAFIGADGAIGEPIGISVATSTYYMREPTVSASGNDYFVSWLGGGRNDRDPVFLYGRWVREDGSFVGDPLGLGTSQKDPNVLASAGGDYVLSISQTPFGYSILPNPVASRVRATLVCESNCPVTLSIFTDNGFPSFVWNSEASSKYRLETTAALGTPVWEPVTNLTSDLEGFARASDPKSPAEPSRFYRVVRLP